MVIEKLNQSEILIDNINNNILSETPTAVPNNLIDKTSCNKPEKKVRTERKGENKRQKNRC